MKAWTLWTSGERRVAVALALVTLVGSGVGVTRRIYPGFWMGPPTFVADDDRGAAPMPRAPLGRAADQAEPATDADAGHLALDGPVDLNAATPGSLQALPGIGPVLAERIIVYRTEVGRFTSVDDLRNVPGIGEKRLKALEPLVTVGAEGSHDH